MIGLVDSYQRKFVYLRLSVTDRCNFRCVYCLPNGYEGPLSGEAELSVEEIRRLVSGFASVGVTKVRLTGGEPTVRRDIVEIAGAVASVNGIRKVALTTNGSRFENLAHPLRQAGVNAVNISVDSLDSKTFSEITGTNRFDEIMRGVERALTEGYENVKINAVLLRGSNDSELARFLDFVKERPVSVRFIELMRTGHNRQLFERRHLSGGEVQFELLKRGWQRVERKGDDGPAVVYSHSDYAGTIGIIAPYSTDFCKSCNRLRVSSRGDLRLCLFGEQDASLRDSIQHDSQQPELVARIRELLKEKPPSHYLNEGRYGNTWNLASIGG